MGHACVINNYENKSIMNIDGIYVEGEDPSKSYNLNERMNIIDGIINHDQLNRGVDFNVIIVGLG
jgi:hypothetical protein